MTKQNENNSPRGLPSREEILEFIKTNDDRSGKREIGKAFGVKGQDKIALKKMLKIMAILF